MGWLPDWMLGKSSTTVDPEQDKKTWQAQRDAARAPQQLAKSEYALQSRGNMTPEQTADEGKSKPGAIQQFFGKLGALGSYYPALLANVNNETKRTLAGEHSLKEFADVNLSGAPMTEMQKRQGYVDPGENMSKSWRGEDTFTGQQFVEKNIGTDIPAAKNPWISVPVGFGLQVAGDPASYVGGGYSAATKLEGGAKLAALGKGTIDAASLAKTGVDAAKLSSKAQAAIAQGARAADLGADVAQEIASAVHVATGAEQAGKAMKVGLPIVRKVGESGKLGAEITLPGLRRVGDAEIAVRNGVQTPTIAARLAKLTHTGLGAKTFATPNIVEANQAAKAALAAGDFATAGENGVRTVGAQIAEHVADQGGIKFAGKTIIPIQGQMDAAGNFLKAGLRAIPGAEHVEGAFNPMTQIARAGNPIETAAAKSIWRNAMIEAGQAKGTAVEVAKRLSQQADPRERHLLGILIPETVSAENAATAGVMSKEFRTMTAQSERLSRVTGIDLANPESIAAARGTAAGPAIAANERLSTIAESRRALEDTVAQVQDALAPSAGKSSWTVGRAGAAKAGEAKGTERALTESLRSADQAATEYERLADIASSQGAKADELAAAAGKTEAPAAATTMRAQLAAKVEPAAPTDLAAAAGVLPDEPRTPIALTPKTGKPKRYSSWQLNLEDALTDTNRGILAANDNNPNATRGLFDRNAAVSRAEDLGKNNPEAVVETLAGRVRSALDAGDLESARLYSGHLDDYAEWYSAPVLDPFFGDVVSEGTPLAGMPAIDLAAAGSHTPDTAAVDVVTKTAATMRERLAAAYKSGRATGAREMTRAAARDAIKAEARQAAAEGRAANYMGVISSLQSDGEKLDAAAEVLRTSERELAKLKVADAVWNERFNKALAPVKATDRAVNILTQNAQNAPAVHKALEDFTSSPDYADYGRLHDMLVEQGVAPDRADQLVDVAREQAALNGKLFEAKRSAGLIDPSIAEKQGEGAGGHGYMLGMDAERPGFIDKWGRNVDEQTGGAWSNLSDTVKDRTGGMVDLSGRSDRLQTQDQVIRDLAGVDPKSLLTVDDIRPTNGSKFGQVRKDVPKQEAEASYRTLLERMKGKLSTETDVARLQATKVSKDLEGIAKADFQDQLVQNVGYEIHPNAPVPTGMTPYSITRNGWTIHYAIPARYGKFVENMDSMFLMDEPAQAWVRGLDRVTNFWKRMATSWNPGFHGRNLASNYWMAWAGDSADPASWEKAIKAYQLGERGADEALTIGSRTQTIGAWREEAKRMGVEKDQFGPAQISESIQRELQRIENTSTGKGLIQHPLEGLDNAGAYAGTAIEDSSRLGVYFSSLEKGMSPEAAAANVDRILYNYSGEALTPMERNIFKRAIPFYTWMRQNIPRMVDIALTQPGKFTTMEHLRQNLSSASKIDQDTLPQYQRDQYSMPVGDTVWAPGMPFADLARTNASEGSDFLRSWLGGMNPVLKTAIETGLKTDMLSGRSIEPNYEGELTTAPGYLQQLDHALAGQDLWELIKDKSGLAYRADAEGNHILSMPAVPRQILKNVSPFLEKLSKLTLDRPIDKDQRALKNDLGATLTGVRTYDYNAADAQAASMQTRLRALADKKKALQDAGQYK